MTGGGVHHSLVFNTVSSSDRSRERIVPHGCVVPHHVCHTSPHRAHVVVPRAEEPETCGVDRRRCGRNVTAAEDKRSRRTPVVNRLHDLCCPFGFGACRYSLNVLSDGLQMEKALPHTCFMSVQWSDFL